MRLPETDGGHVEVGVVSRFECPWARHIDCYSNCSTRKCFDECLRASAISVDKLEKTQTSLSYPDSHDTKEKFDLWSTFKLEMKVQTDDGENGENDVKDLEEFIKGMSGNRACLNGDDDESSGGLYS